jgi:hypothetical protein
MQHVHANLNPALPWLGRFFTSKLDWNLRMKLIECYICSVVVYGGNLDTSECGSEMPGKFEVWCWWRMEKINWTYRVRNKTVLCGVKDGRIILHTLKKRKANWIGHIWPRSCLLEHVTGGKIEKIEVTRRRGRRITQLSDDIKETWGNWKLKEEALDRTMLRPHHGRGCEPPVKIDKMNEWTAFDYSVTRRISEGTHL